MYERIRGEKSLYCQLINIMEYNLDICIVQISDNNILGLFFTTRFVHVHLLCTLQKNKKK